MPHYADHASGIKLVDLLVNPAYLGIRLASCKAPFPEINARVWLGGQPMLKPINTMVTGPLCMHWTDPTCVAIPGGGCPLALILGTITQNPINILPGIEHFHDGRAGADHRSVVMDNPISEINHRGLKPLV
jgi:hypothetical protein